LPARSSVFASMDFSPFMFGNVVFPYGILIPGRASCRPYAGAFALI
jgi:hypothetical protein